MAFRRDLSEHQSSQSGTRIAYTRVRVGAGTRNNPDLREKCPKGRVTRRTPIASSGGILGLGDKRSGEYSFGGLPGYLPTAPGLFVHDMGVIPLPFARRN
ncbi:hypothetical protein JG687_00010020 [Phytophthora cactorum]|uniref:Uncharacterized protein n=1 Tax=Phytophthora cactorum TaxID=29920 RepID=A0A8T1U888_9STRA|nr:hypothetical protein GQ600_19350 [Phytophthora cactorum]KAG6957374.1 hypothetical protein JG687_00010020 [Phytophthora cactorum]